MTTAGRTPPGETAAAGEAGVSRGVAAAPEHARALPPLAAVLHRRGQREPIPARDWALFAMIVLYPVGWLLGLTLAWVPLLAIPMALELFRRGRVRMPAPVFAWLLLCFLGLVGVVMLDATVPNALPPEMGLGRILAFVRRLLDMAAAIVVLLYIGNLTERELPTKRVVKFLAYFFVVLVVGGIAGVLLPRIAVTTPLAEVLPKSLLANGWVRSSVRIEFAQWQTIVGEAPSPRPAAPFQYTNAWGQCIAVLLPWFILATLHQAKGLWSKVWPSLILVAAMVPIVYSLNRGTWAGLAIILVYLVVRMAIRGSIMPVAGVLVAVAVAGLLVLATPLGSTVMARMDNPHSNEGRASLNAAALEAAKASPIIGFGGQSETIGSERSIAIGQSPSCEQCGNRDIGSDGQLWMLLITQGFVGAGLYLVFFLWMGWRFRRDHSWLGIAAGVTVPLAVWFSTIYNSTGMTLVIMMVPLALLWRNETNRVYT